MDAASRDEADGWRRIGDLFYRATGENVEAIWDLNTTDWLGFRAEGVRRERTGLHGKVTISAAVTTAAGRQGPQLGYDTFNLGRQEDRRRLGQHSYKALARYNEFLCDEAALQEQLGLFCSGVEAAWLGQWCVEDLAPAPAATRAWYLRPYLLRGAGTILFAPPEAGKSWLLMLLAATMHHGIDASGPFGIERQARVLFVNLERSAESVAIRLRGINRAIGVPEMSTLPVLNARGQPLPVVAHALERRSREVPIDIIFLDSLSRAGMGSLIDDTTAMGTVDLLNRTCGTWFALGHTPRNGAQDHLYGSIHWDAGADIMIHAKHQQTDDGFGQLLTMAKGNELGPGLRVPRYLRWWFKDDELMSVGLVESKDLPELAALAGSNGPPLKRLTAYVGGVGRVTTTGAAEALGLGASFVGQMLRGPGFQRLERVGQEVFYGLKEKL